jgi:Ca2+-binding RTX toxin-like protein
MQQIKSLIGTPVLTPLPFATPTIFLDAGLFFGTAVPSATEIVVSSTENPKVVFTGNFTVSGNDVTGGTMTGFAVYLGSTKILEAKGFSTDAADLYDAIEAYGTDPQPFDDLIPGAATRFVGSKFGDFLIDGEFTDNEFDDLLLGKKADDILIAFGGDDTLKGGKGNDWLSDYAGTNKFYGDEGHDTFAFQLYSTAMETPLSKIKDFVKGEDLINIATDIPDLQLGALRKKYFHKGTSAEGSDDYIIYDKATGKIFVDYDGSDAGAQIHFASVTPGTRLQSHDFIVGLDLI